MRNKACYDWEERLSLYVDGLLNPFEENAVEAHLARCEACRTTVALWKSIGEAVRRAPSVSPPPELRLRILECTTYRCLRPQTPWLPKGWQLAPVLGLGLLLAWMSLNSTAVTPDTSFAPASLASDTSYRATETVSTAIQDSVVSHLHLQPTPTSAESQIIPQVVISVKASPNFRVSPNAPRWVNNLRLSPIESSLPEPVSPQPNSVGTATTTAPAPPIVTEVADTPNEPLVIPTGNTPHNAPRSQQDPTRSVALADWAQQFNRQLLQEQRARSRNTGIPPSQNSPFIPVVSIPLK